MEYFASLHSALHLMLVSNPIVSSRMYKILSAVSKNNNNSKMNSVFCAYVSKYIFFYTLVVLKKKYFKMYTHKTEFIFELFYIYLFHKLCECGSDLVIYLYV